jgi:hypothetical protein
VAGGNLYGLYKPLCTQLGENRLRIWSAIREAFYKLKKKTVEALGAQLEKRRGEETGNAFGGHHHCLLFGRYLAKVCLLFTV